MIFPSRPHREVPEYIRKGNYTTFYDHENVVQEDGRIVQFNWSLGEEEKGWQFACYRDKYDFRIFEGDEQTGEFAQLLIKSEKNPDSHIELPIADDEQLHYYEYGGFLSGRGGYFITNINEPNRVLRMQQVWMS